MIILVDKLPDEGLEVSQHFEFSRPELVEEGAVLLQPAHAELRIKKIGEQVFIKGKIKTELSMVCSRCLMPYKYRVDVNCDLVYLPEELDSLKVELDEGEINNSYYRDQQIDLREVVLEQLNLTFPVKPLCSENCLGICHVCGKNQRFERCDCMVEKIDPRLQKFKILMKDRQ